MKYVLDTMLNGLKKYMTPAGIQVFTANYLIRKSEDSSVEVPDGKLFRFVIEMRYDLVPKKDPDEYAVITSDKELVKYCKEFEIPVHSVEKPDTRSEFKETAARLTKEITNLNLRKEDNRSVIKSS